MAKPRTKAELIDAVGTTIVDGDVGSITTEEVRTILTDFAEAALVDENLHRSAEYFGCKAGPILKPDDSTAGYFDNQTALQDAIDWSSQTGGTVLLGTGSYAHAGVLRPKSHMNLRGQNRFSTTLRQLLKATSSIETLIVDTNVDGVSHCSVRGLTIDGGWDKRGAGGIWRYQWDEMKAFGLHLGGTQNTDNSEKLNWYASPDTFHHVEDVYVKNIAGTGFYFGGRGEMTLTKLRAAACANDGFVMDSPDNWVSDVTIQVIGRDGMTCGSGNQRWTDVKSWFIGFNRSVEPDGVGIKFTSPSMSACVFDGITTQDTYGPGILFNGAGIIARGSIDEASGGRLTQQGQGFTGTRTKGGNACMDVAVLSCSDIQMEISGSNRTGRFPALVSFVGNGAADNMIELVHQRHSASPWWDANAPVKTTAGYNNAKRHNVVKTHDGIMFHGMRTIAELTDAAHGVNLYKGFGYKAMLVDGRELVKMGKDATSPWVDSTGTVVVTPVNPA